MDVKAAGVYDPCVDDGRAKFLKSFTIGLAYFPDGTVDDWGDLNPCDDEHRTKLKDKGVAISSFRVNVDEMALLRTPRQDEDGLMETQSATLLSVVAYARGVRSIPRVIRVKKAYPRREEDFEGKYGRVSSLSLLTRFDEGKLEDLQWENVGCGACGSDQCLHVGINATDSRNADYSCMLQNDTDCDESSFTSGCADNGTCPIPDGSKEALQCQTSILMAFSGTDGKSRFLNTGSSLGDLAKHSVSDAFAEAEL